MFAIFEQFPDGREMWARRREWPGPGGLMWHMAAQAAVEPRNGDAGLLIGTREEMQATVNRLIHLRDAGGMEGTIVTLVEVD